MPRTSLPSWATTWSIGRAPKCVRRSKRRDSPCGIFATAPPTAIGSCLPFLNWRIVSSLDAGVDVEVEVSGTPVAVGGETERSLILLIREALQNAIRHAAPRRLWISLRFEPGELHLSIRDNGVGFDSSINQSERSQHYGLVGMRERVEHLGGEFNIMSAHGEGTQVRLRIPLGKSPRR